MFYSIETVLGLSLISLLILAALVLLIPKLLGKKSKPAWKSKVKQRLEQLNSSKTDLKQQLIELDKTLEFTLQNKHSSPESLGSNLKKFAYLYSRNELNDIWQAHKLRNDLVHNFDYFASQAELKRGIQILQQAIRKEL
ncbi:MAG: hypothetical protein OHK0017_12510 [Patescibacteria group bacterium]